MGPEDSNDFGQLYLTTKDGHKVPMTATTLCIPDLISVDMTEEDTETNDIAFSLRNPYTASFTVELTDEAAKKLGRFFRATRRWSRKKAQQKKRKLEKEKKSMAYSTKLYADSRCIAEFFSANELREMIGHDPIEHKKEKKICNCPNCGAPINSYICEYCGTEFEKPKKALTDEEKYESFAEFVRKQALIDEIKRQQRRAELQASQEWQTQNLFNAINGYNVNTQIMNVRDSINASMASQTCSLHDQMYNASMQTNIYPVNHDIEQAIPIDKDRSIEDAPVSEADEELAKVLIWIMLGMGIFTLFVIVVTWIYNLP